MIYEFGSFELDTTLYEVRQGGAHVAVEPQVFDLLRFLIEHRERVVTREEIFDTVWHDRFVSESTLSSRLKIARKTIGDSGTRQSMIRTIHGRGFRFVGPVVAREPASEPEPPGAAERPQVRYALSGNVNIAYQVVGSGPVDIVFVMGWVSHLDMFWAEPSFARFLRRLASFSRLILFDKRGTGLSDRVPIDELPNLEQRMDDVRAVMDAASSRRAVLVGVSEGAPMSILFAATYPERTAGLAILAGFARRLAAPDFPIGESIQKREAFRESAVREWGGPVGLDVRAPSRADDPVFREWWATYLRMGASPAAVHALMRMNDMIDVRDVLPTVRVPTLIIHRADERTIRAEFGRHLAANIPGAEYVELPGDDHLPFVGEQEEVLQPIQEFTRRLEQAREVPKALATVVAVRGEGVAEQAPALDFEVRRFSGVVRKTLPGGLLATFDGPARAVRCAKAFLARSAGKLGVAIHTGECMLSDNDVTGPAVDFAMAVAKETPAGEVWVSSTVHDLVAGSGLSFRSVGRSVTTDAIGSRELFATSP